VGRLSNCSGCCCILSLPLLIYLTTTPKAKRTHSAETWKTAKTESEILYSWVWRYPDQTKTHSKNQIRNDPHEASYQTQPTLWKFFDSWFAERWRSDVTQDLQHKLLFFESWLQRDEDQIRDHPRFETQTSSQIL
jgi:hypothetical protein